MIYKKDFGNFILLQPYITFSSEAYYIFRDNMAIKNKTNVELYKTSSSLIFLDG